MDVQRAFVVVGAELVELPASVWRDGPTGSVKQQIASWQGRGPLRSYPQQLASGELVAIYAESASMVIDAIAGGALDRLP